MTLAIIATCCVCLLGMTYTFGQDGVRRIVDVVRQVEREKGRAPGPVRRQPTSLDIRIGKTAAASAKNATVSVELHHNFSVVGGYPWAAAANFSGSSSILDQAGQAVTVVALNVFGAISSGKYVAMFNSGQGWFIISADCS